MSHLLPSFPSPFPTLLIAPGLFHAAWNQKVPIPAAGINHFTPEEKRGLLNTVRLLLSFYISKGRKQQLHLCISLVRHLVHALLRLMAQLCQIHEIK